MKKIRVRRYIEGDEIGICEILKKDMLSENIKDYPPESIEYLINTYDEDFIRKRANQNHTYVLIHNGKIIGTGTIGPYWGSLKESSFFTIFIDPIYKGKGLGRKIIETLEDDEYYKRANRIEIPSSITAVEFYKHFGYGFKKLGNIVDNEGEYRMEKYPKLSNDNSNPRQYNARPYIDNKYHNYKEFVQKVLKINSKELTLEKVNLGNAWIIQLNGRDIGVYITNAFQENLMSGSIYLMLEYTNLGIEQQVVKDFSELS